MQEWLTAWGKLATLRAMWFSLRSCFSLAALLSLVAVCGVVWSGCPSPAGTSPSDLGVVQAPPDGPVSVGLFSDCTAAGWSDVVCASGLRCGLVQVGDPPYQGSLTQCVPVVTNPLGAGDACQFDQGGMTPVGGTDRRYDRCAPGFGCVQTQSQGFRCQKLCPLRQRGDCGKELCVLQTQVTGTGYCAAPDNCQAVFPQSGCGNDAMGNPLGCYVLTDDKGGGTFCVAKQSYGDSTGALNSVCERSADCQPGLACISRTNQDSFCRPYCNLPVVPDGGTPPDLGGGAQCANDLGGCNPISGYEQYGFCL